MDKDFEVIVKALQAPSERDKQRLVGASQIGGCPYHLGVSMLQSHNLLPKEETPPGLGAWIGTGTHLLIEHTLKLDPPPQQELKVSIFEIPGYGAVNGNVDMYWKGRVWDWKVLGKANMQKMSLEYRKKPNQIPNTTYRTQQHLYGFGLIQAGYEVTDVNIVAIPKLSNRFSDIVQFTEPYNQELVDKSIERAKTIWQFASDGKLEDLPKDFDNCYDCSMGVSIRYAK